MKVNHVTQERLKERVVYNPLTGVFRWRVSNGRRAVADHACGSVGKKGYVVLVVDKTPYQAHRLAWLYVHGWLPEQIDHVNTDKTDNRLCNLRPATNQQNTANRPGYRRQPKGVITVQGKYRARIRFNDRLIHLGYFETEARAAEAYRRAAQHYFGEYARA